MQKKGDYLDVLVKKRVLKLGIRKLDQDQRAPQTQWREYLGLHNRDNRELGTSLSEGIGKSRLGVSGSASSPRGCFVCQVIAFDMHGNFGVRQAATISFGHEYRRILQVRQEPAWILGVWIACDDKDS